MGNMTALEHLVQRFAQDSAWSILGSRAVGIKSNPSCLNHGTLLNTVKHVSTFTLQNLLDFGLSNFLLVASGIPILYQEETHKLSSTSYLMPQVQTGPTSIALWRDRSDYPSSKCTVRIHYLWSKLQLFHILEGKRTFFFSS